MIYVVPSNLPLPQYLPSRGATGALQLAACCPLAGCGFLPADCQETCSLRQGSLLLYQVFLKLAKNEEYALLSACRFNPSRQLGTMQLLAHIPATSEVGERIGGKEVKLS